VLQHLNRELLDLAAADNPFIAMVYALFDRRNNSLSIARAGGPHPIHVPCVGQPKLCQTDGTLLGVFDTPFVSKQLRLRAGDKVLFHTDGADCSTGSERLLSLVERYRALPVGEFVERLFKDLLDSSPADDLTLLGLELGN
jgi:serine phosphatase RsbU (regulator of sigma subunit)